MATESIQYEKTEIVTEKDTDVEVVSFVQEQVLIEEIPTLEIVEAGMQGPPGPPGPPSPPGAFEWNSTNW